MKTLGMYLSYNGQAEEAFNFYAAIFNGKILETQRYGDSPMAEQTAEADKNKMMHMSMDIGSDIVLMACDVLGDSAKDFGRGANDINISIQAENKEEADRLFSSLSEGGKITMPIGEMFWNAYFGMCDDKYGVKWMVNMDFQDTKEE